MILEMEDTKTYEITKAHLEKYKKFAEEYVKQLGLFNWERYYKIKDFDGVMAACGADTDSMLAILTICSEWADNKPTDAEIRKAAKHEVLELLLWQLCEVCQKPGVEQTDINQARHEVINRLMGVMK